MNKIKKYQFGGAIAAEPIIAALAKTAPVTIPLTGMGLALYMDHKYPERTAYYKGTQRAKTALDALAAREFQLEAAQNRAEAEAYNKGLAKYYNRALANGPIVTPYVNGGSKTITAYNPIEGTYVGKVEYPSGSYMEGTFPELNFRHINGADLAKLSNATITYPNKGTFTAKLNSIDGNTAQYVPGTLVQGLTPTVNLPASIAIDRLTNVVQPSSVPLVMSKKFNFDFGFDDIEEDEIIEPDETGATPTPEEPKNPKNSWWKRIFRRKSKDNSQNSTSKKSSSFDQIFRLDQPFGWYNAGRQMTGITLKSIPTIGTIGIASELVTRPLVNSGRIEKTPVEYLLDLYLPKKEQNQPEPVKQEQSEPTYDSANLKELIKRRNERQSKIDSLNNAR